MADIGDHGSKRLLPVAVPLIEEDFRHPKRLGNAAMAGDHVQAQVLP